MGVNGSTGGQRHKPHLLVAVVVVKVDREEVTSLVPLFLNATSLNVKVARCNKLLEAKP